MVIVGGLARLVLTLVNVLCAGILFYSVYEDNKLDKKANPSEAIVGTVFVLNCIAFWI